MSCSRSAPLVVSALALLAGPTLAVALAPAPDDLQKPREIGDQTRGINSTLARAWEEQKLTPAPKATDYQFIRRVYLDLIGRIATPDEVRAFVQDGRADKRILLVERLLRHPDFARHWASVWTRILLPRPIPSPSFERLNGWLEEQFQRNLSYKELFLRLLTASGREDENPACVYVLSHLGLSRPQQDWAAEGEFTLDSLTDHSCRAFLGINLNCCQCHDHPFTAEYRQSHWWGLNGFFRQVDRVELAGPEGQPPVRSLRDNREFNAAGRLFFERRNGKIQAMQPEFLDGTGLKPGEKRTRRQVLADLMVNHPQFSHTIVNRLWTHFLGQLMNENGPFDDTNECNPVVHKELLDFLAQQFSAGGYDLKKLMLWICTSDAYQLQFNPTPQNLEPGMAVFCSTMRSKRLGPEQRLESMLTVLRAREILSPNQLARVRKGWLATQDAPSLHAVGIAHCGTLPAIEICHLEVWRFLYENQELHDALAHPEKGTVARILASGDDNPNRILDAIYLAALNRRPTPREVALLRKEIQGPGKDRKDLALLWQDLLWVLLNSSEFIANY